MFNGIVLALWPVMWIVVNALLLYNIAVRSGRFDAFRAWLIDHLPDDRRVVLVVIGFCFGALLEGISGFGTPVAITSSLLILIGFPPLEALVFVLIFNTAPVAFGALGVPVTVLGAVTGLPATTLGAMIGRQLPFIALILPFYVMASTAARARSARCGRCCWSRAAVSRFRNSSPRTTSTITLTDVLASLGSLVVTLAVPAGLAPGARCRNLRSQHPALGDRGSAEPSPAWQGWLPWIIVSAVVILWTSVQRCSPIGRMKLPWPGLDNAISITLYDNKPYAAIWAFQPLGTGTAILGRGDPDGADLRGRPGGVLSTASGTRSARSGSRSSPSAASSASPIS